MELWTELLLVFFFLACNIAPPAQYLFLVGLIYMVEVWHTCMALIIQFMASLLVLMSLSSSSYLVSKNLCGVCCWAAVALAELALQLQIISVYEPKALEVSVSKVKCVLYRNVLQ